MSHIIDRMAFKVRRILLDGALIMLTRSQATTSRTADEMLETLEALGGNYQCASSRETLMYQAASFNAAVPTSLGLLAETIREPLVTDQEVAQQIETAEYEIREIWSKPELIFPELVNVAAYKDNTLGNPLLCPQERLPLIKKHTIEKYRNAFFRPERLVVAFVGIKHEEALRLTESYFGDMRPQEEPILTGTGLDTSFTNTQTSSSPTSSSASWTYHAPSLASSASKLASKIPFFKNLSTSAPSQASISNLEDLPSSHRPSSDLSAPSHYTGGFLRLPTIAPPANPALPRVSHIHLAFEALPIDSDDIYALATLQMLLGGGGSFSAGGPGKGMYSRLYTNVLNQYSWVESCAAFNLSYTDSGVFGIGASCSPARVAQMLEVMCRELSHLALDRGAPSLQPEEVKRAKNQLKSSLLMNLESRMVELEDLGRQVQIHGRKVGVKEMCAKIDALTVNDLREVAKRVVGGLVKNPGSGTGKPTVVIQEGDQEGVTRRDFEWPEIQERIARWKLGQ